MAPQLPVLGLPDGLSLAEPLRLASGVPGGVVVAGAVVGADGGVVGVSLAVDEGVGSADLVGVGVALPVGVGVGVADPVGVGLVVGVVLGVGF
ncbi:hypothetical protein F8271_31565, partial [Micromonospora sp. ALFpr18c]|uniref:hypothetical protein n=1 Tax=Micromonospora sp. ALFpr18c TaxID=1458665 RepID=UPI001395513F